MWAQNKKKVILKVTTVQGIAENQFFFSVNSCFNSHFFKFVKLNNMFSGSYINLKKIYLNLKKFIISLHKKKIDRTPSKSQ